MKKIKVLCFITLLLVVTSCEKDEVITDFATEIAGTYAGTITETGMGSESASSKLSRSSDNVVDLIIFVGSITIPIEDISVSRHTNSVYNLLKSDSDGSFTGAVQGNKLDWTITSGNTKMMIFCY